MEKAGKRLSERERARRFLKRCASTKARYGLPLSLDQLEKLKRNLAALSDAAPKAPDDGSLVVSLKGNWRKLREEAARH